MILLLDTSTGLCQLSLVADDNQQYDYQWQADRELAHGLIEYLRQCLAEHEKDFADIDGIGVVPGPGSFTGLRIGLTVLNTLASDRQIPIVAATGQHWQRRAVNRLRAGDDERLVMPQYGRPANVTQPRK